jgi:hypothetical protein
MASIYHIVAIRVNETSWAHVWRLRFRYLRTGYDKGEAAHGLGQAGEPSKEPHTVDRVPAKEVTATCSPRRPPPLERKQNRITSRCDTIGTNHVGFDEP